MECTKCHFVNPAGMKFCGNCGNPLASISESEERKIVTILFADLKGYTTLSERLDPEDVKELMDNIFQKITEIIERHKGFVDKYLGDGVMALFGAPVAHEDDAEKAVGAAIEIQDFVKDFSKKRNLILSIRIGINTGEVIAGLVGKGRARDYTVMGDAVNTAQRLQEATTPGTILISETTKILIDKIFAVSASQQFQLKGKTELINAFKIESKLAKPILQVSPFINRKEEHEKLLNYYERCVLNQKPLFCLIVGELGIGKSRLIHEFEHDCLLKVPVPYVLKPKSTYFENVPFSCLAALISELFEIKALDTIDSIKQKIENGLTGLGYTTYELKMAEDFILYLLGSSIEKTSLSYLKVEDRKLSSFAILGKLLSRLAELQPLILVFDDIDSMDTASLEFIKFSFNTFQKNPIFFIMTCRRYFIEKDSFFQQIPALTNLVPLNKGDCQKLMRGLMADSQILKPVENYVLQHVEGNPLFLEEMLRSIKEHGGIPSKNIMNNRGVSRQVSIPPTLQAVLSSRIDSLPDREKEILRTASIIGKSFPADLLSLLIEGDITEELMNLLKKEYIMLQAEKEISDAVTVYRFRHILFHEIIYNSILKKVKNPAHIKIANWLENKLPSKDLQLLSSIAFHYEHGESFDKASQHYEMAADIAADAYANEEAIKFYSRALELLANKDIPYKRILLKNAEIKMRIGKHQEASRDLDQVIALTDDLPDKENLILRCKALRNLGNISLTQGESAFALAKAEEALSIAQLNELIEENANCLILLAQIHRYGADHSLSLQYSHEALPLMEKINDYRGLSNAWYSIGVCHFRLSKYDEAWKSFTTAKKICQEHHQKAILPRIYEGMGAIQAQIGKYNKAFKYLMNASIAYKKIGHIAGTASSYNNLGAVLYYLGNWDKALEFQKKALHTYEIIGDKEGQSLSLSNISILMKGFGQYKKALKYAHQSLSMRKLTKDKAGQAFSLNNIAALLIDLNGSEKEIVPLLREALDISEAIELVEQKSYALSLQARFLLNNQKLQEASSSAEEAHKISMSIKNNEKILESRFVLFELALAKNDINIAKKMAHLAFKRAKRLKQRSLFLVACYYQSMLFIELKSYENALSILTKIILHSEKMKYLPLALKAYKLLHKVCINLNKKEVIIEIEDKLDNLKAQILKNIPYGYKKQWESI